MKRRKPKPKKKQPNKFGVREIGLAELKEIIERTKAALSAEDYEKLEGAVDTLAYLLQELEKKGVSLKRLRRLLFGASSEKTSELFPNEPDGTAASADENTTAPAGADGVKGPAEGEPQEKPKRKGHGRNGTAQYRGATKVKVPHATLKSGAACPQCEKGKVYPQKEPKVLIRVVGMAPLQATVYEYERLRCNLCGVIFTATAAEDVGEEKYDETAASMIALLKYGAGLPFNRIEKLENSLGIPLPAGTQWEIVASAASLLEPAYEELIEQAAQGNVLHNDDTTMKILELERPAAKDGDASEDKRTGVYTSGIVSVGEGHKIALFFTGQKHAGENLERVLLKRAAERGPPIQMCDMLSHNTANDVSTIVAGCMAHSRRRYAEVVDNFPEEVRHVLEELKKVYHNDDIARKREITAEERLVFHQAESGPVMEGLKKWLEGQLAEKKIEPNSSLGEAINFMLKHWEKLTLFLRVAGAPLDNNIVERSLKKAILHRKNSLFYKTENGAHVGDLFMSFIHTAELNGVDPFAYLVAMLRHREGIAENPSDWMPWNYQMALRQKTPPGADHLVK